MQSLMMVFPQNILCAADEALAKTLGGTIHSWIGGDNVRISTHLCNASGTYA